MTFVGTLGLFTFLFFLFIRFLPMIPMSELRHDAAAGEGAGEKSELSSGGR